MYVVDEVSVTCQNYDNNAAAVYIEKGKFITVRNCIIHDNGNGIFAGINGGLTSVRFPAER